MAKAHFMSLQVPRWAIACTLYTDEETSGVKTQTNFGQKDGQMGNSRDGDFCPSMAGRGHVSDVSRTYSFFDSVFLSINL